MGNIREKFAFGHRSGGFIGRFLGLHTFENHHSSRDKVVIGQVNPSHAAVGDNAQDFVLAGHHVAGLQLRRRDLFAGGFLGRIDQGIGRFGRGDKGQPHHAIGHAALGAVGAAALTEGIERAAARALRGILLGLLGALLFALGADIIQIRQKAGDVVWVDGTIAIFIVVRERIESHSSGAGFLPGLLIGEGVKGHGRSALFLFVRKGVERNGGGGGAIVQRIRLLRGIGGIGGLAEGALGIEVLRFDVLELVVAKIRVMAHGLASSSMYLPAGRVGSSK